VAENGLFKDRTWSNESLAKFSIVKFFSYPSLKREQLRIIVPEKYSKTLQELNYLNIGENYFRWTGIDKTDPKDSFDLSTTKDSHDF
jgi:hypothetical protein